MRCSLFAVLAAVAGICLAGRAGASIVYTYVVPGATSFNVAPGSTFQVPFSIQETLSGGDTSLILGASGLDGAGVSLAPSGTTPMSPTTITSFTNDAAFGAPTYSISGDSLSAQFTEPSAVSGAGPTGTVNASGGRTVALGFVTLKAGSGAGTTTTFLLGAANGGAFGPTITHSPHYNLDISNNNGAGPPFYTGAGTDPTTFSVTITPEPSGLGLLGAVALAALRRRRRRRSPSMPSSLTL